MITDHWFMGSLIHSKIQVLNDYLFNKMGLLDVYMQKLTKSSLLQIMACCLFGTELSDPMLIYWTIEDLLQWYLNKNMPVFIQEKLFENVVCKIIAICLHLNVFIWYLILVFSNKLDTFVEYSWISLWHNTYKKNICTQKKIVEKIKLCHWIS